MFKFRKERAIESGDETEEEGKEIKPDEIIDYINA